MGGGIGMGNTCKAMDVSFQCITIFTTNKKKIKKKEMQNKMFKLYKDHTSIRMAKIHNFLSL